MAKSSLNSVLAKLGEKFDFDVRTAREQCKEDRLFLDSPGMNYILGGGFMPGRVYMFSGPESGGKTTLATYVASQIQKHYESHRYVLYADFEYSLDINHAADLGLDIDNNFILMRPKSGEDFFDALPELLNTGEIGLVVIDSITMINSKAQLEDSFSGFSGGKTANVISVGLKKIAPFLYTNKCSMIMIAQERANIGGYGADFKIACGYAPKFVATFMARVSKTEEITNPETKELMGIKIRVRNTKNKIGVPKRDAILKLIFNKGIDSEEEYFDYLVNLGIVKKTGAMYEVENDAWGMGRVRGQEAVKTFLKDHPEIYEKVKTQINDILAGHNTLDEGPRDMSDIPADYFEDVSAKQVEDEEIPYEGLDVTDEE